MRTGNTKTPKHDSTVDCVLPLMDFILYSESGYSGCERFNKLLTLALSENTITINALDYDKIFYSGHPFEMRLKPPKELLIRMLETLSHNKNSCQKIKSSRSGDTKVQRLKLIADDESTRAKQLGVAKKLLIDTYDTSFRKEWYIFESESQPDIFIVTEKYIFVVEAKQSESEVTNDTTYLSRRNQLIRHIQGAMVYDDIIHHSSGTQREIIAFYIVDETQLKTGKYEALYDFNKYVNNEEIPIDSYFDTAENLKMPRYANKAEVCRAYKGYTTWQKINKIWPQIKFYYK